MAEEKGKVGRAARLAAKGALGLAVAVAVFVVVGYGLAEVPEYGNFAVSPVLLDKDGEALYVGLSAEEELVVPVALGRMGELLPKIAVGVEDKRFYRHPG
ncbi:MAG: hypothetical protein LBJ61_09085, partial [Deltaproteobacteria bacterium]|nr:hypothetical protein [Deltaproteobacteria bacterium]